MYTIAIVGLFLLFMLVLFVESISKSIERIARAVERIEKHKREEI